MNKTQAPISPLMEEFSGYVATVLKRKLPAEVSERARIHLVDAFGAMIAGSRLLPGRRAVNYVRPFSGPREAGVVASRIVTSAAYAALANGICGHADETDDVHSPSRSHPGVCIVPTVLAVAEREQVNGERMLRAMVLGYDVCARLLLALKDKHLMQSGFHASSKGGLFGAAAAASALLKLDAQRIRYVVSYCAQQAAGLFTQGRDTQHIEKAYVSGGMPAQHGIEAALMVASGFTGVEDVLSGEPNLMSVFSPDADRDALVRGLGREYEILRASIKYWPAGGPAQAPLHVLRDMMREHGFNAADVEKLALRMPSKDLARVDNRAMPDTNVQHLLSLTLIDGNVTFKSAHDYKRMQDPRVLELRREHIVTAGDDSMADPQRRWRCAMEITLKDGRRLAHQTMAAKGIFENPLSRAEIADKALDLMAPVLGRPRSQKLIATLLDIDKVKNARELRKLYAA